MNENLKAALWYANNDWLVFPCHGIKDGKCMCGNSKCESQGKHPLTKNGVKDATTDNEIIEGWFTKWPDANVTIATGKKSNLIVVDIDPRHGGFVSLEDLENEHGILPLTPMVVTGGGGLHYYFAYPTKKIKNAINIRPGIDIRSDGGYVIAASGNHISGKNYAWKPNQGPGDTSLAKYNPDWLPTEKENGKKQQQQTKIATDVLNGVPKGQRDDTLFRYACKLRAQGLSRKETTALILIAADACKPKFPEEQARRKVESAWSYPQKDEKNPHLITNSGEKWNLIRLTPDGKDRASDLSAEALAIPPVFPKEALVGPLKDYVRYITDNTEIPTSFAFSTYRNLLGLAIGRKLYVEYGSRKHSPVFYDALIGRTAFARKDTAISLAYGIVRAATSADGEKPPFVVVSGVGSAEALLDKLAGATEFTLDGSSTVLLKLGEFSTLLDKATQTGCAILISRFIELWDLVEKVENPTRKNPITVKQPTMSLLAGSAVANIYKAIGHREIEGGFVNRFCWWLPDQEEKLVAFPEPIPQDKIAEFTKGVASSVQFAKDLSEKLSESKHGYPVTPQAKNLWRKKYPCFRKETLEETQTTSVIARIPEHVWRHAVIFAVLMAKDKIDEVVLEKAIAVGDYLRHSAIFVLARLSDTASTKLERRVFTVLLDKGEVIKRFMMQMCGHYYNKPSQLWSLLATLRNSGFIHLLQQESDVSAD